MTLTRPLGRIFPVADATMSIVLDQAQISAMQNRRMMTLPIARPIGDGGVSTISSAAGRNANSSLRRPHGREPMRDHQHGAAFRDVLHILLNDALALIVQRACRLVEDQDARVGDERARNGDALA